jgi:hypothetical protein
MRSLRLAAAAVLSGLLAGVAHGQTPTAFALQQNVPDPFCSASGAATFITIQFAIPRAADVVLSVWTSDETTSLRTLVNEGLQTGYHSVTWDGRDELGGLVPDGTYPYRATAREPGGVAVLFEATLVATVSCRIPSDATTWSLLKSLFSGAVR